MAKRPSNPYPAPYTYRGIAGEVVRLKQDDSDWYWRVEPSPDWYGPFSQKIDALNDASHSCGRSCHDMEWEPSE